MLETGDAGTILFRCAPIARMCSSAARKHFRPISSAPPRRAVQERRRGTSSASRYCYAGPAPGMGAERRCSIARRTASSSEAMTEVGNEIERRLAAQTAQRLLGGTAMRGSDDAVLVTVNPIDYHGRQRLRGQLSIASGECDDAREQGIRGLGRVQRKDVALGETHQDGCRGRTPNCPCTPAMMSFRTGRTATTPAGRFSSVITDWQTSRAHFMIRTGHWRHACSSVPFDDSARGVSP